jgi:hypothetical protein
MDFPDEYWPKDILQKRVATAEEREHPPRIVKRGVKKRLSNAVEALMGTTVKPKPTVMKVWIWREKS